MKKYIAVIMSLLICAFFASSVLALELKTSAVTITLPDGWKEARPMQKTKSGQLFAVRKGTTVATIGISPIKADVKVVAAKTCAELPKQGIKVKELEKVGDSYRATFSKGKNDGMSFFTSNGKATSVVTVLSATDEMDEAAYKELFDSLKAADPKLFPSEY